MTVSVSPVMLVAGGSGNPEAAELWDAITDEQVQHWENNWQPELLQALTRLNRSGVPVHKWTQSNHWDWRRKSEVVKQLLIYRGFSIVCEGMTQGLMIVDTASRCRLPAQKGQHLVEICFLEVAPWNRALLVDPPRYQGIGSVLVRAAIELSKGEGFKGRIGLHSLPQADGFYTGLGMTDLGPDPGKQNLRYFEMDSQQAEDFLR